MGKLSVPFIWQAGDWACGAACLEMVYRFYRRSGVSQRKIYETLKSKDPHHGGRYLVATDAMVRHAQLQRFNAKWFQVTISSANQMKSELLIHLERGIPLIVCQRSTDDPHLGHFRIVTGFADDHILAHDPSRKGGGAFQKWAPQEFMKVWQPSGVNVTGGVAISIENLAAPSASSNCNS